MKIVCTSDTHEKHGALVVPAGDVFLFAGDLTMDGEDEYISSFNTWLGLLPHKYKIVIPGNHDRSLDREAFEGASRNAAEVYGREKLSNCTHYLLHSGCEIEGVRFWGSPYTPIFHSDYWKFHYDRAEGKHLWDAIPEGVDVLITHGPPLGILDRTLEGEAAGCWDLRERVNIVKPKYHVFGHIHEGYGRLEHNGTVHLNVSALGRTYKMRDNPSVEIDL